jgi:hypothetical protein
MAESLRGGLSLGLSGFGFWSHDRGGRNDRPDYDFADGAVFAAYALDERAETSASMSARQEAKSWAVPPPRRRDHRRDRQRA